MFQEQPTEHDTELWGKVFEKEIDYIQSRQDFLKNCTDRIGLIKTALHNPTERGTALRLIEYLNLEERQSLLDDLIDLASVSHSDIELCRKAILSFSKTWLLANIEKSAEPLLQDGTDEEYRRLLELYIDIDRALAQTLALRALQHDDPDIREVGEDFQNYLENGHRTQLAIERFSREALKPIRRRKSEFLLSPRASILYKYGVHTEVYSSTIGFYPPAPSVVADTPPLNKTWYQPSV